MAITQYIVDLNRRKGKGRENLGHPSSPALALGSAIGRRQVVALLSLQSCVNRFLILNLGLCISISILICLWALFLRTLMNSSSQSGPHSTTFFVLKPDSWEGQQGSGCWVWLCRLKPRGWVLDGVSSRKPLCRLVLVHFYPTSPPYPAPSQLETDAILGSLYFLPACQEPTS